MGEEGSRMGICWQRSAEFVDKGRQINGATILGHTHRQWIFLTRNDVNKTGVREYQVHGLQVLLKFGLKLTEMRLYN